MAGCCHLPAARSPRSAQIVPASICEQVAYTRCNPLACTESNLLVTARYTVRRVVMPSASSLAWTNRALALDCYAPATSNKVPAILILPILGGEYPLENHFARYFARHGMAAVIVRRDKMLRPERIEDINAALRHAAIDARQALDWIESRPELDSSRIGMFGVSMGGIRGAFLLPIEPRIRAAVLGLAGGDLPWILKHSEEPGIKRRRPALLKQAGIAEEDLEEHLRASITCDPLSVASAVDPRKVLLVLAACDTAVPVKKGWELRKAMGKPETLLFPTGHYTTLLFVPYIRSQCLKFFRERFAAP